MPITFDAKTQVLEGHQELVEGIRNFSEIPVSVPHNIYNEKFLNCNFLLFGTWSPGIKVYANGYDSTTEGYVCVEFVNFCTRGTASVNLDCVIAIIDAERKTRFPKSFSECHECTECENYSFRIDRYISRRVLLNEPLELIPGNTLSLYIDIVVKPMRTRQCKSVENSTLESCMKMGLDGKTLVPLDSKLGKRLCEESKYFECLRTTPLTEGGPSCKIIPFDESSIFKMKQPDGEYKDFVNIERILFCTTVEFFFMDGMFSLYRTADKYDIPLVVDFCRSCLELSLTSETAHGILEFAEEYHDDHLRETAEKFLESDCRLPDETEFVVHSRATGRDYEWVLKMSNKRNRFGQLYGPVVLYKGLRVASDTYDFYR